MIKKKMKKNNMQITKRLTAILVAVVFVFGMMNIPAGIYAAEPDTAGDAVNAAETATEATSADASGEGAVVTEGETAEEPSTSETKPTEAAKAEAPDNGATVEELTELVVVTDEKGDDADLKDVDKKAYDGFIYKIKDDVPKKEIKKMEKAIDDLNKEQEVKTVVSKELYSADSLETITEVVPQEQIEYIEPNYIIKATGTNDPNYAEEGWYLDMINAPYVWGKGMLGDRTTVAVLDSGIKTDHEEFKQTAFTAAYNVIDPTQEPTDNSGHGTAVSGIIAAAQNNQKGLTGIMPRAKIMPVKVMDYNPKTGETTGTVDDVIKGIEHALNNGADVINLSAGIDADMKSLRDACQTVAARGVILVASAGNDYSNKAEYPAMYDSVVGVGSIERNGAHSSFSNYNQSVAVSAPGREICAPYKDGGYAVCTGTSFSAPQVAAMAAMIKQMDRNVNYDGFMKIIAATSTDKGAKGYDPYFGYGLMNLAKAYNYMAGDISMYEAAISSTSYVYDGKVKTPSVVIKRAGKALSTSYFRTTYSAGRAAVGTYRVTAEGINGYTGSRTFSYNIIPPLVKSIKAPKRGKKKLTVRWKAMTKKQKKKIYKNVITGYQVRVSTHSNFANARYASVKGIAKTSKTVKGLKKKTYYYVQYRSYKTVGSKTYYSKWSGTKKAKTK